MKFCPECGNNVEGMKFCSGCGYKLDGSASAATIEREPIQESNEEKTLLEFSTYMFGLEGKKETFMKIPQEHYELTNERLKIIKQGMISKSRDDIELFKIKDIVVHQKMKDKMMKVGDIEIFSSDESSPKITMKRIKDPHDVKEAIRSASMKAKDRVGVTYRQDI